MRLKSAIFNCYTSLTLACGITFNFTLNTSPTWAIQEIAQNKSQNSSSIKHNQTLIASNLALPPEAVDLVKDFEGFSPSAYTDTNGLPVIGYGQTRINGQTVRLGQYITQAQANISLLKELAQIQNLVKSHVQVDLNPHQLGALTSLVFNAGTVILTDSTLIRKLNAGDYTGAAQEFPRWNKADKRGQLVPFPGLTRRRLAEKKLFLTPSQQIASN